MESANVGKLEAEDSEVVHAIVQVRVCLYAPVMIPSSRVKSEQMLAATAHDSVIL